MGSVELRGVDDDTLRSRIWPAVAQVELESTLFCAASRVGSADAS